MSDNIDVFKKPHSKSDFTEDKIAELMRCVDDPIYFIETFVKIQHPTKGMLPFKLYDFQKEMVRAYHEHRFNISLTARQMGKTATSAAYLLWRAMFNPDTTILVVANNFAACLEIMDRIRFSYENLPNHIRAGAVVYNKSTVQFDNGSKIVARATTPNAGRGLSISLLYADEFSFVAPNIQSDFFTAVLPVLSTGGSCIITSTPKSDTDEFATLYRGAMDTTDEYGNPNETGVGSNGFKGICVPWHAHPDRDEEWAKTYQEKLGPRKFAQEFDCQFITDDPTLIDPRILSTIKHREPAMWTEKIRWYVPELQPNQTYLVALDPSVGVGNSGDSAAIQVFSIPQMQQVAEWKHNGTVARGQVRILMQILIFIDGVLREHPEQNGEPEIYWTVENNTIGEHVLDIINEVEDRMPGMFVSEKKKKGQTRRFRKGFNTDNRKKVSACARFKSLVESYKMSVYSEPLIRELKNYVSTGVGFSAKPGEHDDLVSACLLIVRMLDVVLSWTNGAEDLKETITDDELYDEPTAIVV